MNVLNIENVSKTFGDKKILDEVSYGIHGGDRIGLIGLNGTGKSTLLKMIAGQETPDEGQVVRQNGLKISYLPQTQDFPEKATVLSYMAAGGDAEAWDGESRAKSMLNTLGITDHQARIEHLSGGQKKRVALAKVLKEQSDVIILDEPTVHLDEEMVAWLENYLSKYKGVVIMVTHDRYFLDNVANKILEISHGKLYGYEANYSKFLELKAQREEMELASDRKRQSILRMELEWAKRGCRARSTKQRARLERLEALKNGRAPAQESTVEIDSIETRLGKKTVELHHISKNYSEKTIIEDFNYIFLKNQKIGIIGANGCGKSTLLKIIAGREVPDRGWVELGETVRMSYFAQEVPGMDENQKVIDYVKDIAEYITTRDGKITASQMLERFLFTPDMQYSPIGKLSGGEKRRLYLLATLQQSPNCIILDEIDNQMDIPTLTILEDYLNSFVGIVVMVSHDRYFLDNVADRIFAFEGDGHLTQYEGGYTDYLEAKQKKAADQDGEAPAAGKAAGKKRAAYKDWKQEKPAKLKFTYKEQREFDSIDDEIALLEERIEKLDKDILQNATHSLRLNELMAEKESTEATLELKMERWVYLNDLKEKIEAQS